MLRGKGLIPDDADPRDWSMASVLAAPRTPKITNLEKLVRRVRDQGQTSACVGCALASALDVRQRALDFQLDEPSAMALYGAARSYDSPKDTNILQDTGSRALIALKAARELGVPREQDWPFNRPVTQRPSWNVWSKASACRVAIFGRSVDIEERVNEVDVALYRGFPVLVGFEVDEAFENYKAGQVLGAPQGSTFGGHMVVILSTRNVIGSRFYRILNSWGETFGDSGFFSANELWLRAALEVRVCEVAL